MYTALHCHTHGSNIISPDVVITEMQLVARAKELNMTHLAITEHGSTLSKINFQKACEKHGIQPIFGMEGYFVPDINEEVERTVTVKGKSKTQIAKNSNNGHIIFLAKNKQGLQEINLLMSDTFEFGFYYKPRCDIAMIRKYLSPENVIISTACYGSFLKKEGEQILQHFQPFISAGSFYLELQPHNNDKQKEYNAYLMELHRKLNIPYIITTDVHAINDKTIKLRTGYLHTKNIIYDEEDGGWMIDMPSYDDLVLRMKNQGILTENEIQIGLANTNAIAKSIQPINLLSYELHIPILSKYKHLTQEQRHDVFEQLIYSLFDKYQQSTTLTNIPKYLEGIAYELGEIKKCNMADYFLCNYEIIKLAIEKYGGVLTKTSRGSASCYFVNFLLGFTAMDRFKFDRLPLFPQRFITSDRILKAKTTPDKIMSSIIER